MEIINNYKSQNLFDSLKRLKAAEIESREAMSEVADKLKPPDMSRIDDRTECLEVLKKIDTFHSLIEESIKAASNEIKARKNVIKELDDTRVFYNAQYADVKVVANAYRIYGKRLKNVKQKLSEKQLLLPSQSEASLCVSESSSCALPFVNTSLFDSDNASDSGVSSKILPGSSKKRLEQSPKPKFNKLAELFVETKSDSEKQMSFESDLIGASDLKCFSPNIQNENISDLQITADQQKKVSKKLNPNSVEKSSYQGTNILDRLIEKEKTENDNEIELLLEESYDMKKAKSNIDLKRKMEFPLQFQEKNICTDAPRTSHSDSKQPSNTCEEGGKNLLETQ